MKVRARVIFEPTTADRQTQALMRSVLDLFDRCVQLDRAIPEEAHLFAMNISEPGWLADMIATSLSLNYEAKLSLLTLFKTRADVCRLSTRSWRRKWMCSNWRMKSTRAFRTRWIKASVNFISREQMRQIQDRVGRRRYLYA